MFVKETTLKVEGTSYRCPITGNPDSDQIFLTIGPGSLYFPIYSDRLKDKAFFIAFDGDWIHDKDAAVDEDAIAKITINDMVAQIAAAVDAVHKKYPDKKINLLANSVLTKLALICAEKIPALHSTICIGTPVEKIDAEFSDSKTGSTSGSVPKEKSKLEQDQELYDALMKGKRLNERLQDSNVKDGSLTPNSVFVEQCRSFNTLTLANLSHVNSVLTMWRNVQGQPSRVINPAMRLHFFGNLQSDIDTSKQLDTLEQLGGRNVTLFWGAQDGITPPPSKDSLEKYAHIKSKIFSRAGHFPQLEGRNFDAHLLKAVAGPSAIIAGVKRDPVTDDSNGINTPPAKRRTRSTGGLCSSQG